MARLAFFGTPEFAAISLESVHRFCLEQGHDLVLVVTKPDQRQGRGKKMMAPPVKVLAQSLGIKVCQPETLRKNSPEGDEFFAEFISLKIDLAVVVAYGKIITQRILSAVSLHFVNVHGSLLPRFRGAAPVQRAIMFGDKETGVCLMDMVLKLDEGDVFVQEKTPIISSDTSATLFRRLAHLGAHLLYENLANLLAKRLTKTPQASHGAIYATMLEKAEGQISFRDPGRVIHNKIRAFDLWPHVFGYIHNHRVNFFNSFFLPDTTVHPEISPGTIVSTKPFLGIKTVDGILYCQTIQLEGKKALPVELALHGFSINPGDKILGQLKDEAKGPQEG